MKMKRIALPSLIAGSTLALALTLHFGLAEVGRALAMAGWRGLALLAGVHLFAIGLMGAGWWQAAGGSAAGASLRSFVWGRLVRDGAAEVLPVSQIGGYVLGARALILHGLAGARAVASTVVDVTLELCGQVAYTALGLLVLLHLRPDTTMAPAISIGLALAIIAVIGFFLFQQHGVGLLDRLAARLARDWLTAVVSRVEPVRSEIDHAYRRHGRALACFLLHLAVWLGTAGEAWLALRLMGVRLGLGPVLVIESVLYAARSAAFFVPNAMGVQEGAYILLGTSFGLPPDMALALSLLKRGRDLVIGVPALLAWQLAEGQRFWRRAAPGIIAMREPPEGG
jgi:putative membrane protein